MSGSFSADDTQPSDQEFIDQLFHSFLSFMGGKAGCITDSPPSVSVQVSGPPDGKQKSNFLNSTPDMTSLLADIE